MARKDSVSAFSSALYYAVNLLTQGKPPSVAAASLASKFPGLGEAALGIVLLTATQATELGQTIGVPGGEASWPDLDTIPVSPSVPAGQLEVKITRKFVNPETQEEAFRSEIVQIPEDSGPEFIMELPIPLPPQEIEETLPGANFGDWAEDEVIIDYIFKGGLKI